MTTATTTIRATYRDAAGAVQGTKTTNGAGINPGIRGMLASGEVRRIVVEREDGTSTTYTVVR